MTADLIISYDGTPNDDDALALGKLLAQTGSSVALAYVRHSKEFDPKREELAQYDAEQRLERGAELIGIPVTKHVVVGGGTGEGLGGLAEELGASIIVFGSDYRTPLGRAEPGTSAQRLLEGGSAAIAVPFAGPVNDDARATAGTLAGITGAEVVDANSSGIDLIVVGSREGAPKGRVLVEGEVRNELNSARSSVLVLPAETRIEF